MARIKNAYIRRAFYPEVFPAWQGAGCTIFKRKIVYTAVLKWALPHGFITTAITGYTTFQQMEKVNPLTLLLPLSILF